MNNLDIFQENIHLIENIKLFSGENKLIYETLLTKLKSGEKLALQEIPIDPQLIEKIFKFASIKHILNSHQNNQEKMFELLEEVSRDLKNYDLEFRIEELESKFSKDLSKSTFNEIRETKNKKHQLNPLKIRGFFSNCAYISHLKYTIVERIITKSFARLMGRGTHRGFVTFEELNKSLGKRNLSDENLEQAFMHILDENVALVEKKSDFKGLRKKENSSKEEGKTIEKSDDPIRMYLREMGGVELLSREGEIAIAKRIEAGKRCNAYCISPKSNHRSTIC